MNSQQELLNAINSIAENKNRSYDTPAEVLRVEGDTVWVHIDGGADETPVLKTINCEQGEKVQVRIANGNAFLVGNASAPPTDDKRANEARFIAEQADVMAGTAIKSVNALSQTVESKVDTGDSNIEVLSSTMYQNANGVNIFNGNLAVGDSYAHIDGNSFDIKQVTTAGTIDDTNDPTLATFNATETVIGRSDVDGYQIVLNPTNGITIQNKDIQFPTYSPGWIIHKDYIKTTGRGGAWAYTELSLNHLHINSADFDYAEITNNGAEFYKKDSLTAHESKTEIEGGEITCQTSITIYDENDLSDAKTIIEPARVEVACIDLGDINSTVLKRIITPWGIFDENNVSVLDEWTSTATVSNNAVSFSGLSDSYGYDLYCENKLIGISAISKSGSGSNVTLTYTLTGASNGDVCKLRILR